MTFIWVMHGHSPQYQRSAVQRAVYVLELALQLQLQLAIALARIYFKIIMNTKNNREREG